MNQSYISYHLTLTRLLFCAKNVVQSKKQNVKNILTKKCWDKSWEKHCEGKHLFGGQLARHEFNGYRKVSNRTAGRVDSGMGRL